MSLQREAQIRRFHQYGPWVLGGGALAVVVIVEALRKHVVNQQELIYFAILIPSIVLHEVSHGAVAYACGDPTAKEQKRLTLNPLRHIDPLGTIILPIFLTLTAGISFGWAKPVPVSTNRLRHPRNQAVLVGLAGPATNIVLALAFGLLWRLVTHNGVDLPHTINGEVTGDYGVWGLVPQILFLGGMVNVVIAAFNLIPIPPLDGSAVVERLLPRSLLPQYYSIRQFFMVFILIVVFFFGGALDSVFNHALSIWLSIVQA